MADKLVYDLQDIKEDRNTNLKPENLKAGITCLGVVGTMETGVDTSDADATANDIAENKTAYVNGEKIIGNIKPVTTYDEGQVVVCSDSYVELDGTNRFYAKAITMYGPNIVPKGCKVQIMLSQVDVAEAIGLTADKIKAGETILGITGTYTGENDVSL